MKYNDFFNYVIVYQGIVMFYVYAIVVILIIRFTILLGINIGNYIFLFKQIFSFCIILMLIFGLSIENVRENKIDRINYVATGASLCR